MIKNHRPRFSIITIVLNGDRFLERAIKSVINQSYKDFEYLVIDGGSSDRSVEITRKYENHIARWINEPDRGIGHAFNKGIQLVRGQFIGFVNYDDYYLPETLQTVDRIISEYPEYDIYCGAVNFFDYDTYLITSPSIPCRIKQESTVHQSSSFIRSDLFTSHPSFREDLNYAMDYDFFFRMYLGGKPFKTIDKVLSVRDINGITKRDAFKAIGEVRLVQAQYLGLFKANLNYVIYAIKLSLGRILRRYIPFLYRTYWHITRLRKTS